MAELRITVGVPASGKSTLCREWEGEGFQIVSSDETRRLMLGSMEDFSDEDGVWDSVHWQLDEAVCEGQPVALDATNLVPKFRSQWLDLGKVYGIKPVAYRLPIPYGEAFERNRARDRVVPDHVMLRMHQNFLDNCAENLLRGEGFVVRTVEFCPQTVEKS